MCGTAGTRPGEDRHTLDSGRVKQDAASGVIARTSHFEGGLFYRRHIETTGSQIYAFRRRESSLIFPTAATQSVIVTGYTASLQ